MTPTQSIGVLKPLHESKNALPVLFAGKAIAETIRFKYTSA